MVEPIDDLVTISIVVVIVAVSIACGYTLQNTSSLRNGRPRILFYHAYNPHYGFTNFSNHPVVYDGREYPTSEHLFQSFKVCAFSQRPVTNLANDPCSQFQGHEPAIAEHIRTCSPRPSVALSEARRYWKDARPDWKNVNIAMVSVGIPIRCLMILRSVDGQNALAQVQPTSLFESRITCHGQR